MSVAQAISEKSPTMESARGLFSGRNLPAHDRVPGDEGVSQECNIVDAEQVDSLSCQCQGHSQCSGGAFIDLATE